MRRAILGCVLIVIVLGGSFWLGAAGGVFNDDINFGDDDD